MYLSFAATYNVILNQSIATTDRGHIQGLNWQVIAMGEMIPSGSLSQFVSCGEMRNKWLGAFQT